MRIYFNLVDSQDSIPDLKGVEVVDISQAYSEAERAIAEMFQEDGAIAADLTGWHLDAVDPSGAVLFSIDLNSVVH
jgi:hypothetical protein